MRLILSHLPAPLLSLLITHTLAFSFASASPAPLPLVQDSHIPLMPLHTLFLRQVSNQNLQTFTSNIGGFGQAPPITNSGNAQRPFEVDGDTFTSFDTAAQRSCDKQFTACANGANKDKNQGVTVGQCDTQKQECNRAQNAATVKNFQSGGQQKQAVVSENIGPDPEFPEFDLICEA